MSPDFPSTLLAKQSPHYKATKMESIKRSIMGYVWQASVVVADEVANESTEEVPRDQQIPTEDSRGHAACKEDVELEEPSLNVELDASTATLGQLLTKIVPDADVHSPNVIVVGSQSSGKTKMIISMVFHHLIENSSVTDAMCEKLLRIFQTGEKMVTRRPTKVQFVKIQQGFPCTIKLRLGSDTAAFGESNFDAIIDAVHQESANKDGKAFGGELSVTIFAPGLPNVSFTDLPGLITDDRSLADCRVGESMSIRKLVKKYMRKPQTTLIVVEPASIEDFETSQVSPLLKEMKDNERPDIFDNAVLVLSKCDKIRQGLEGRIVSIIDGTSPNIRDFPYRHVVGVTNKNESRAETTEEASTYIAFKQLFKKTKEDELTTFSAFRNKDGTPCSTKEQCTTAAVFHQMDKITFGLVHHSIKKGLESIQEKVDDIEQKIRDELAPPLAFYDCAHSTASVVGMDAGADIDVAGATKPARSDIIKLALNKLEALMEAQFNSTHLHVYDYHQNGAKSVANEECVYLASVGVEWPASFAPGSMQDSRKRREAINTLQVRFDRFVNKKVADVIEQVLSDPVNGCFAAVHSPFHRIDRFSVLVAELRRVIQDIVPGCLKKGVTAINAYLGHFWEFEVPKGVKLSGIVDQLKHVALRSVFDAFFRNIQAARFDALLANDTLFQESDGFAEHRGQLQGRWQHLRQQADVLRCCSAAGSNDELRAMMLQAHQDGQVLAEARWLEFWASAAESPSPSSAVLQLSHHEQAMDTDDDDVSAQVSDSAGEMADSGDECSDGELDKYAASSSCRKQSPAMVCRDLSDDIAPPKRAKMNHNSVLAPSSAGRSDVYAGERGSSSAAAGSSSQLFTPQAVRSISNLRDARAVEYAVEAKDTPVIDLTD